ncbi:C-C chemokine receptor type 4 [Oryzias melastigma]|uniref:C-C chemokine receptor type 4 n=1 Tax=Oryzias melastigma TaxID=30732 RepID=A0A3B3DLA9_ORYME|nr:C-C chemokine receptor type 4 [Oryzias melastigma]XP_036071610.1 C-C chemokine receptor type 4 [Oryzias melastigma]XP_036071611.1 C-C chemokine receptor type 4 [Oryzias melastigma]KAF6718292.1 C-C chemokine receptor type 4 [Oryzias melastigma]KAF6725484.1 C-C chemokine receptor type 4 [Oryzias melastigma]
MTEASTETTPMYDYTSNCDNSSSDVQDGSKFFLVLYCMMFGFGLLANCTVLWVLIQHIKLRMMTDVLLLNLVMSDLLLAVSLPLWILKSQSVALCKVVTGIYQLGFYGGTFFVTLMSVDRYLAIVHAVAAMRARALRYGIIASVVIWTVSVILAVPQVAFASLETEDSETFECHPVYPEETIEFWKKLRNFSENTVGIFLCLPIMIFCYVKILLVLSKSRNSKKDKVVKLIFTVVCVFIACWVPYNILVFLQTLEQLEILDDCEVSNNISRAMHVTETIALSHCCLNPIIYAFMGEKFRKSLGNALKKHFCHKSRRSLSHRDTTENETSNTGVRSTY